MLRFSCWYSKTTAALRLVVGRAVERLNLAGGLLDHAGPQEYRCTH